MSEASVYVVAYDPSWIDTFEDEKLFLEPLLAPWRTGPIEHVGSTAVVGLCAKPVIDIMVGVTSLSASEPAKGVLRQVGYQYADYKPDVMHWFCKPSFAMRTHHLHLVPFESSLWHERVAFRNLLRTNSKMAEEYAALKRELARRFEFDREAYTDAKHPFIMRALGVPGFDAGSGIRTVACIPVDEVVLTPRCRLRYPQEADIPFVWSASRETGFNDGMRWDPPSDLADLDEPLRRNREAWAQGTSYSWTVEGRDSGTFIGRIGIRREPTPGEWSIGFWTHPEHQGKGYAVEVAAAMVEFGFRRLGADIVSAGHATWNEASRTVLERIGMRLVRVNPQGFQKRGHWVEVCEYELRRTT